MYTLQGGGIPRAIQVLRSRASAAAAARSESSSEGGSPRRPAVVTAVSRIDSPKSRYAVSIDEDVGRTGRLAPPVPKLAAAPVLRAAVEAAGSSLCRR